MRKKIVTWVLAVATICMFMHAAGMRILMRQDIVQPGERFVVDGWGDLGGAGSASLVCRYFTGVGTATSVFWYSPNNVLGRNGCALMHKQLHSLRR